jgi:nucleotide-binding universal stress UspA family protein
MSQRATIHLLYVLVVPRSLPMGTPLPEEETQAKSALARAESIVKSHGLKCTVAVERSRNAGEGIILHAKHHAPDLIVTGMRPIYGADETLLGRTTDRLLRDAPCEVIIDKLPSE